MVADMQVRAHSSLLAGCRGNAFKKGFHITQMTLCAVSELCIDNTCVKVLCDEVMAFLDQNRVYGVGTAVSLFCVL